VSAFGPDGRTMREGRRQRAVGVPLSLLYRDEMVGVLLPLDPRLRERAVLG